MKATASDVEEAERAARWRAMVFYALAAAVLLSVIAAPGDAADPLSRIIWTAMAALAALNLTPIGGWARPRRVRALMNDEATRLHRLTGLAAGFWAALVAALATGFAPVDTALAARVVVSAGLVAGLCAFATLELRAARD